MQYHKTKLDHSNERDFRDKLSDATGVAIPPARNNWSATRPNNPRNNWREHDNKKKQPFILPMPDKRTIGKDGSGHINCVNNGVTSLGRDLSTQSYTPFRHKFAGPFASIESFIWFLRTEDDVFRQMTSKQIGQEARQIRYTDFRKVPNDLFTLLVADAIWQQINENQAIAKKMIASSAPFDLYFIDFAGIRIRLRNAALLSHTFEQCRQALKSGVVYPDFTKLFEPNSTYGTKIYDKYCEDNDVAPDDRAIVYKELIEKIVRDYFYDLIDYERLEEIRKNEVERSSLKAGRKILSETSKEAAWRRKQNKELNKETAQDVASMIDVDNENDEDQEFEQNQISGETVSAVNESVETSDDAPVFVADASVSTDEHMVNAAKTVGPTDITVTPSHLKLVVSEPAQLDQQLIDQQLIDKRLTQQIIDRSQNF